MNFFAVVCCRWQTGNWQCKCCMGRFAQPLYPWPRCTICCKIWSSKPDHWSCTLPWDFHTCGRRSWRGSAGSPSLPSCPSRRPSQGFLPTIIIESQISKKTSLFNPFGTLLSHCNAITPNTINENFQWSWKKGLISWTYHHIPWNPSGWSSPQLLCCGRGWPLPIGECNDLVIKHIDSLHQFSFRFIALLSGVVVDVNRSLDHKHLEAFFLAVRSLSWWILVEGRRLCPKILR